MFPGYYLRKTEKFTLYVSKLAYDKSDELEGSAPLEAVDKELARIVEVLPESVLKILRPVPIWVEWDDTDKASPTTVAIYRWVSGPNPVAPEGTDPRKMGCLTVLSLKRLRESAQRPF